MNKPGGPIRRWRLTLPFRSAKAKAIKGRILNLLGVFDEGIRLFEEARDTFELPR